MKNISEIANCYGCGVCAVACPRKIIKIQLNSKGFYTPKISDYNSCTHCGACVEVCSYSQPSLLKMPTFKPSFFSGWSKNDKVRSSCSSGGVAFEIVAFLLNSEYKACGVRYNTSSRRAEHFIANDIDSYKSSIGSKYIQSFTFDAFVNFDRKTKYIVTGTPCQIDSLRRYIRRKKIEDNFVLLDFFCHGVPSMLMWNKYIKLIPITEPKEVSWRNKQCGGWHDSWVMSFVDANNKYMSKKSKGDIFYSMFLGHHCLNSSCFEKCKYKQLASAADIRVGDLWGTKYELNQEGVNGIVALTDRGYSLLKKINNCHLQEESKEVILAGQMKTAPKKPAGYNLTMILLRTPLKLSVISFIARLLNKLF